MGATASMTGTLLQGTAKVAGGIRQKQAMDAAAGELDTEAGQSVASGIQGAIQDRRKATYIASNAQARTAGSGLATTGASAIANQGQIMGQGEYNARTAIYQGEDRANELTFRGTQMRAEGSASQTAGFESGVSSVLKGGQSFFDKYGDPASLSSYPGLAKLFAPSINPNTTYASDYSGEVA